MRSTRRCTSGSASASITLAGHLLRSRRKYAKRFFANCWRTTGSQRTKCSRFIHMLQFPCQLVSVLFFMTWPHSVHLLQLYCESCQRFLADRFVVGSCPMEGCDNDTAMGDQCERCGRLLNSTELIDPKCRAGVASAVLFGSSHHASIFHVLNFYNSSGL